MEEDVKLWEQYRNCYQKDDTRYEYYSDDEALVAIEAGRDGVTSAHIKALKALHRHELNSEARNHQKRYDGEKTIHKVLSYDALDADALERMDIFQDCGADPERILDRKMEISDARNRVSAGLARLSEEQRRLLYAVYVKGVSQKKVAEALGVSESAISQRLNVIGKKFC